MPTTDVAKNQPRAPNSSALWLALERIASPMVAAKGSHLFRQGEAARGVFLLHKGRIRLYLHASARKAVPYRIVGPGSILGFPATFANAPYSLTAENLADCELGFVRGEEVLDLMSQRSDLCFHAAEVMSQEVRELRRKQAAILSAATNSEG